MASQEITFSWEGIDHEHKDLQPLEWLEYFASSLTLMAAGWDESLLEPNFLEKHFEDCKEKCPNMSKMEMYSEAIELVGPGSLFQEEFGHYPEVAKYEINTLREEILKAFEDSVIFPDILRAVGIIESVLELADDHLPSFCEYPLVVFSPDGTGEISPFGGFATPEQVLEVWHKDHPDVTEDYYKSAFSDVISFCNEIKRGQFSQKLRESAWAIEGYTRLKVGSEKYAETEKRLAKRYEQAYRSFGYAESELLGAGQENVTDRQAYDYLCEHGFSGSDDYELPVNFETWQRYVRRGRRKHGTQKNTPRAGRSHGRSMIKSDEIQSISEISSQYPDEEK